MGEGTSAPIYLLIFCHLRSSRSEDPREQGQHTPFADSPPSTREMDVEGQRYGKGTAGSEG